MGGAPQHPVGNGLLAEQFPEERRGFAISAHISGGNVGTVVVALAQAWLLLNLGWRWVVVLFGIPAIVIALAILFLVRETGVDRQAAVAHGSVRDAFRSILRDPDHRWIYLASVLGGGGRGLGVVNLFALAYLSRVIGLPGDVTSWMYGVLIVLSVPMPLVAGWLSDRVGRRPVIIGVYVGGAVAFIVFLIVGSSLVGLWAGILLMGLFSFAESPQLQALLADIADPRIRDASFALYFTLAFGVGSLWTFAYGQITAVAGESAGLPIVFVVMAVSFLVAALAVIPIREQPLGRQPARA
jgi:MFS family permease